jgi:hypothetical protein
LVAGYLYVRAQMNMLLWCAVAVFLASVLVVVVADRLILHRLRQRHAALFRELKSPVVDDFGLGFVSDAYRAYRRFVRSDRHAELGDARLSTYVVVARRAAWAGYAAAAVFGMMFLFGGQA